MFKLRIWRQIVNYNQEPIEGYEISNEGKIYSYHSGKILKDRIDKKGYNNAYLNTGQYWKVSRLTALAYPEFCGKYFEGADVDHINGCRSDNRVENLRWVTHKENCNNPITLKRYVGRNRKEHPKPITINGIYFDSQREAAKYFNVKEGYISAYKRGVMKNARKLINI